jgi:flagellar basal-body rod protein FlgG
MRALWTAASGMAAQQMNVDTISNNLANVNTSGYKKERLEFKSLLYQTLRRADLDPANQTGQPVNLQVGLGVRPIATSRLFEQGNFQATGGRTDFAIEGGGFFVVERSPGEIAYTKDGTMKLSVADGGMTLVTSEGFPVLDINGDYVVFPDGYPMDRLSFSEDGAISYTDPDGLTEDLGIQIALVQFMNPQGLESVGSNLFKTTAASGAAVYEVDGGAVIPSRIAQGYVEMSNVQVAEEMVNLIVAQRAYELNSKAITTSDEMLQTANNIRR